MCEITLRGFVCTSARGGGKKKSETFPIGSAEFPIFLLAGFSACYSLAGVIALPSMARFLLVPTRHLSGKEFIYIPYSLVCFFTLPYFAFFDFLLFTNPKY
jgi:hypothetical protein